MSRRRFLRAAATLAVVCAAGLPAVAAPPLLPKPAPTCANQGYRCPVASTCLALAALPAEPKPGAALDAYRCMFVPPVGVPGQTPPCPGGLVVAYVSSPAGPIGASTPVCMPPGDACPSPERGWTRWTPVAPLPSPLLGYTCRYRFTG